jgi:DNA-binding transcriptional ArsR family regulator
MQTSERKFSLSPTPDEFLELEDPRAIRALAHPVRLAILELLRLERSANATECARSTGESPQSCSYHLRTLARWGFVRRLESSDGRETRWGAAARGFRFGGGDEVSPALDAASTLLTNRVLEHDEQVLKAFMQRSEELEPEWRESAQLVSASVHVTTDELREIDRAVGDLVERYRRRGGERPRDSRRVHVVFRAVPYVDQPPKEKE